jgi:hypothetical protein
MVPYSYEAGRNQLGRPQLAAKKEEVPVKVVQSPERVKSRFILIMILTTLTAVPECVFSGS